MDAGLHEIIFRLRLLMTYDLGALRSSRTLSIDELPVAGDATASSCVRSGNVSVSLPSTRITKKASIR